MCHDNCICGLAALHTCTELACARCRKAAEFSDARFAAGLLGALQPLLPPRLVPPSAVAVS